MGRMKQAASRIWRKSMTKQKALKRRIRERMEKTGESYTSARAQLLAQRPAIADSPKTERHIFNGYTQFGGLQDDTAILAHLFAHAGLLSPVTDRPYSEVEIHGLCGGVGFLQAVFEYKGHPPMLTIVPRSRTMPQTFIANVFERVGIAVETKTTTSAAVARKHLDAMLDEAQPVICLVDAACLPHSSMPRSLIGAGPHHVAVIGKNDGHYWIDDRALSPIRIAAETLAEARAAYRAGKHAAITLGKLDSNHDWRSAWRGALIDTVETMRSGDPTVPEGFRSNTGLAGLEKWQGLLTASHKKGWPLVFDAKRNAFAGLMRAFDGICHEYTAPAAGRPLYAAFLELAADALDLPGLLQAADHFRASAKSWQGVADTISQAPDEAVRRSCEMADEWAAAMDASAEDGNYENLRDMADERRALGNECKLSAEAASALYAILAERLVDVVADEKAAVEAMMAALELNET
jgi:hypothetical protein